MSVKDRIKGMLTWSSLLVIAPLAFFGLYLVLSMDAVIATLASVVTRKKVKSGYEEICEQWELHHDD
jgi:hypothetical protein